MDVATLVNGQPASFVDVWDRGLAYGDGVFETIAVNQGQVQLWQAHQQRLISGLLRLGIVADETQGLQLIKLIVKDIQSAYVLFAQPDGVLKIIVTRGSGGRGYAVPSEPEPARIVSMMPWPKDRSHLTKVGVCVRVCQHRWSSNVALAGVKHLNRLDQVMARNEWNDSDIHEGVMLNQAGLVASGVMSNVFIETNGALITPKIDDCGIDGTMAKTVVFIAKECGIRLSQSEVTLDTLVNADGVFFTNSLNGIWPLVKLLPHAPRHPDYDAIGLTHWAISTMTIRLQKALALHLSKQVNVGDLC